MDIRSNPYKFICDFYEEEFPCIGKKIFSILSLSLVSLVIPRIPALVKETKQKISLLWISPPGCMPKGSRVLMANGEWKNIELIRDGEMVLSPQNDGTILFSKVKRVHSWESPKNYEILNKKNNSLLYKCSYNHKIPYYNSLQRNKYYLKKDKAEYLSRLNSNSIRRKRCFSTFPILKFKDRKNCEIEPYTLGVWLGDGHFSSRIHKRVNYKGNKISKINGFYKKGWGKKKKKNIIFTKEHFRKNNHKIDNGGVVRCRRIGITTANLEIINEVKKHYRILSISGKKGNKSKTYNFSIEEKLGKLLSKENLEGKGSGKKFIPKKALLSDIEYRKKLLAGLIDTDGYFDKKGMYSILTKSKELARDIKDLVFSLGYRVDVSKVKKRIKSINFEGEYYNVSFCLRDLNIPLQLVYKKRENYPNLKNRKFWQKNPNTFTIKFKEYGKEIVYGFEVDSPSHNFITDNWMVTGNSGKSSIADEFERIAINPISTLKITPARLYYEIKKREGKKTTLIAPEVSIMFSNEELIKLLEGYLGEESSVSRSTMRNVEENTNLKVDGIAYLAGTPQNISDRKIRDGLLGRTSPILTFFDEKENIKIIDKISSRIGKDLQISDKKIIHNYFEDLYKIQEGNHNKFNPIKGYIIPDEIIEDIKKYIKKLIFLRIILKKWGIHSARPLEETYRFMVSHSFLNIWNREIKDDKLVIIEEDCLIAKKLIKNEAIETYKIFKAIERIDWFNIKNEREFRLWDLKMKKSGKKLPFEEDIKLMMREMIKK